MNSLVDKDCVYILHLLMYVILLWLYTDMQGEEWNDIQHSEAATFRAWKLYGKLFPAFHRSEAGDRNKFPFEKTLLAGMIRKNDILWYCVLVLICFPSILAVDMFTSADFAHFHTTVCPF